MEKSYIIMKENSLIHDESIDKWKNKINKLNNQREELNEKILLASKKIKEEKNEKLKKEEEVIKEIRKILKRSELKRYYRFNKSKVDLIVENLKNNTIEIGKGLEQLIEIKEKLELCIAEQNSIEEKEIKEILDNFPEKDGGILVKYINSRRFKDRVIK